MIPYGRQEVSDEDIDAVSNVLRSDWLTQGPQVPKFERLVADLVGAKHAIAVNSATSALHIACMAIGLGPGDWLWTTPNTFVASANCGLYCGADVDFVDINSKTLNMDVDALEAKLVEASRLGTLPKVIVPVHFGGLPTDQETISLLAKRYGFKVIEDASHSIGAANKSETVGSCKWSDVTVFSFHPVKIITSGEGGMCVTNNDELASRMSLLRTHGITKNPAQMESTDSPPWKYEQLQLGFNYRMTDIHAALGISQVSQLKNWVSQRNQIADRYKMLLNNDLMSWQEIPRGQTSSYHLFVVMLKIVSGQTKKRNIYSKMHKCGIAVNVHYEPVHLQPFYKRLGFCEGMFPVSERYATETLTLPLFPAFTESEQDYVVSTLHRICEECQ